MQPLVLRPIGSYVRLHYRTNRFGNEVPGEGPALLVAGHPDGLIDPILMGPEHAHWVKGSRCHRGVSTRVNFSSQDWPRCHVQSALLTRRFPPLPVVSALSRNPSVR